MDRRLRSRRARQSTIDIAALVRRYPFDPGDILAAGSLARTRADSGRHSDISACFDGCISQRCDLVLIHRLGGRRTGKQRLTWDRSSCVTKYRNASLSCLTAVSCQHTVSAARVRTLACLSGRSVSALFSGPPGAASTMVAALIAKKLGLRALRVDLSRVVSK